MRLLRRSLSVRPRWSFEIFVRNVTTKNDENPMTPKTKITLILTGLSIYLMFPVDIIPDVIPVFGQLDDMGVVLWGVKHVLEVSQDAKTGRLSAEQPHDEKEPLTQCL